MGSSEIEILDRAAILSNTVESFERLTSKEGALLLLDKPYGETSFFMVNRLRSAITRATGIRKVKCGHAGTLDPLATGLLILATRGATKLISRLIGLDKTYQLRMRFGVTSPSLDLERPIEIVDQAPELSEEMVIAAVEALRGEHEQVPPIFSAIKQHGRPVYKLAHAGLTTTLLPRTIFVHAVEVIGVELPYVTFRVRVSKGTYVRSLVRDLAVSLGTVGILVDLVREAIGEWMVADALTLAEATRIIEESQIVPTEPLHF